MSAAVIDLTVASVIVVVAAVFQATWPGGVEPPLKPGLALYLRVIAEAVTSVHSHIPL